MIRDHPKRVRAAHDVVRHVRLRPIHEPAHDVTQAVQLRHRVELVAVQQPLHEIAVHAPADPSVAPVDRVLDERASGQPHQRVCGPAGRRERRQVPVRVVAVHDRIAVREHLLPHAVREIVVQRVRATQRVGRAPEPAERVVVERLGSGAL